MKKLLFVGCGDGAEIEPLRDNPGIEAVGLEPSENFYRKAMERFALSSNIEIIPSSLQRFSTECSFDIVYFVFPTPITLAMEGKDIAKKLKELLRGGGKAILFTEVALSRNYVEFSDFVALSVFLRQVQTAGWKTMVTKVGVDQLPAYVRESAFGKKLFNTECTEVTRVILEG